MLEVNFIRLNRERVLEGLKKRNFREEDLCIVDEIIQLDNQRKQIQTQLNQHLSERNSLSKEIGVLYKSGNADEAEALKMKVSNLKTQAEEFTGELTMVKTRLEEALLNVPNVPHPDVPFGSKEEDNEIVRAWEKPMPDLGPEALSHWELAEKYQIIDFKLGAFITGSGFPLFRGKGARLQRALVNFFLDEAYQAGYEEVVPPLVVNADSARATGQLPDKEGQMYVVERDELYLIPTAEVPLTNMYRGKTLPESAFPIRLAGYTPCFRREAGSYGAHVKGLNRVHQFDKVEIVHFEHPQKSYEALQNMIDHVSALLDKLELPYRILRLCGGDLGFTSAITYDFEVFSAAQKRWLEVSSVSNFETFQSHRMHLKFKDKDGKTHLAHTLNGSAIALARIIAALLENNQTEAGIKVPSVLQKFTRFDIID